MPLRAFGPYQHGQRWRVVLRGNGTVRYQSFDTLAHAEQFLAGARDEASGITVGHAIDALLDAMRAEGLAASTLTTAEFRLEHILGPHRKRPLRWLTHRGAEVYQAAAKDRSPDTHHAELALASRACALAVKRRWLKADPFADVEPVGRKRHGRSKQRLRVDESRVLWDWCVAHASEPRAVITLAYLVLGARVSELVKRNVRDLDDGGRLLWIEDAKTRRGDRSLIVPDPLRGMLLALARRRAPDAPLFVDENGEQITRRWAAYHVAAVCREAGVPVLTPQALRRTHSDVATDAGVSSSAVAAHLGHTSSAVTDRSYRDRGVTRGAQQGRALRVIKGGKR